jgi:hypothetical protein
MNGTKVIVIIPSETQDKIDRINALSDEIPQAVKRGMDFSLDQVRGRIQIQRMSGKGPYPPEEHRLGIVTQNLQRSLRREPAVIVGNTITGDIGTNIFYGKIHEYGWSGMVVRGGGQPYRMTIPERAVVRTGVSENADYIATEIANEIDKSLEAIDKG